MSDVSCNRFRTPGSPDLAGEPRTTADVDAIVFVSPAEAESLVRRAAEAGFDVRTEVERERLAKTGTMRFRRGKFQIDLITASLPFEETAYGQERRPRVA